MGDGPTRTQPALDLLTRSPCQGRSPTTRRPDFGKIPHMRPEDPPQFTVGQCPRCAEPYRLPATATGKRARCRACGEAFVVSPSTAANPAPSVEVGQVIYHQDRRRDFELAIGDTDSLNAISEHIERHIGPIHSVFHEIISDLVHIDLHWVKPSAERPWQTIITTGMSDRPMHPPEECSECRFAELILRLPPDWRLAEADFQDEAWYWPLRWLKILARMPHEYETWLWEGHSAPNGDPPEPFAPNTKLCAVMLCLGPTVPDDFHTLQIGDRRIVFFSMIPLYADEVEHKLEHGYESILARFEQQGIDDVLNITRPNVCRRRFLGLF